MAKDPYKGSPYDASGMPLSTTFADYDNADEVAQKMVRTKGDPGPDAELLAALEETDKKK